MIVLLADAAQNASDSGLLGGLIGAAGGVGFAIWYGYHVTTKTIPSIVKDFREERLLDREEHKADRDTFATAIERLNTAVSALPCRELHHQGT